MPHELEPLIRERLGQEVEALFNEFQGRVPRDAVERSVDESLARFSTARIQQYVPPLVHGAASERLGSLVGS